MRNWKPDDLGHLQDAFVRTRYFKKSLEKKRWPSHYAWPWNKFTNLVCKVHPGRKMISHVLWKRCKEKNKQTTYSRKNQHTSKSRTLECIRGGKSNFVRLFFFRFLTIEKLSTSSKQKIPSFWIFQLKIGPKIEDVIVCVICPAEYLPIENQVGQGEDTIFTKDIVDCAFDVSIFLSFQRKVVFFFEI